MTASIARRETGLDHHGGTATMIPRDAPRHASMRTVIKKILTGFGVTAYFLPQRNETPSEPLGLLGSIRVLRDVNLLSPNLPRNERCRGGAGKGALE